MELNPREAAFILDEMDEIENSEKRLSSEKREAARIRKKAEEFLIE